MNNIDNILNHINEELIRLSPMSELDEWLMTDAILLGELLSPDSETFSYTKSKGIWEYFDSRNNLFFVRLYFTPSEIKGNFMIFKTGWFENNDRNEPRYEPNLPDNVSPYDSNIRTNTVAKIYRDELIPLFKSQDLANKIIVEPISTSRYQFAIRLIKKFTPKEFTITETYPTKIVIEK